MERIDFQKEEIPFTQVANGLLYDKKVSLGAKTIYAFMYSKPSNWQFSAYRIAQELGVSKTTVLKHLTELKENAYLFCKKLANGRMLYKVVYPPVNPESKNWTLEEKPESKKATVQKSHGAESSPISNKEIIVISKTSNTSNSSELPLKDINEVIVNFKNINPVFSQWYKNTTQRGACTRLLETHGLEQVIKVIKFLPKTNAKEYYPNIQTPLQLEQKWSTLENAIKKDFGKIIKLRQNIIL
jgi:biotin operon repressor